MTDSTNAQARQDPGLGQVPLSALEHFDYCPRQAGLIILEDGYADDAATIRGTLLHHRVHEPGEEVREGLRTLRSLPVWHEALGLTGICDVVEIHDNGTIVPVEHKSGDYHPGGPADVQVGAQAMCLEEMFNIRIDEGMIFTAADRRRHRVAVDSALRARVTASARQVRIIMGQERLPPAIFENRCRRCSINHACMPKVMANGKAYLQATAALFSAVPESGREWP